MTASSTGLLLKTLGLRVTAIKIDPYMNIDAGTMSPTEHGRSNSSLWKRGIRLILGLSQARSSYWMTEERLIVRSGSPS